jgi:hypothetical protein
MTARTWRALGNSGPGQAGVERRSVRLALLGARRERDVRFCRLLSLHRRLVEPSVAEHRVAMAATAPVDQSRELGSAAVAHLSQYRGTSREHTESDLRVFFTWCQDRQLAPLTAQRHDLELYLR